MNIHQHDFRDSSNNQGRPQLTDPLTEAMATFSVGKTYYAGSVAACCGGGQTPTIEVDLSTAIRRGIRLHFEPAGDDVTPGWVEYDDDAGMFAVFVGPDTSPDVSEVVASFAQMHDAILWSEDLFGSDAIVRWWVKPRCAYCGMSVGVDEDVCDKCEHVARMEAHQSFEGAQ